MERSETQNTTSNRNNSIPHQHEGAGYAKVYDQRKQRLRGLWERTGTFYAQSTMPHAGTGLAVVCSSCRPHLPSKTRAGLPH